ncbi:DNase I-like protein [Agrocybe pediades]|nr:DNase I-like protein [Agrocybe pediades]
MKVATLNIRGGHSEANREKWSHLNRILKEKRIAILAIQEGHLTDTDNSIHILKSQDPTQPNAKGVAVILNKQLTRWNEAVQTTLIPGRAIQITIPWRTGDSRVNILAVYAPNASIENAAFWASLTDLYENENHPPPDLLLGDFNMVEDMIDRMPPHPDAAGPVENLLRFKANHELSDGWRATNPTQLDFSYVQSSNINGIYSMSRIDRIYTTKDIFKHSRQWEIQDTAVDTDHKLVSMEFTNPGTPYIGKGRWVIPLFLLENRKAKQAVEELGKRLQDKLVDLTNPEMRTEEFNVQLEFYKFKKETTKLMRNLAKTETPKLDKKIGALKEQRKQALNERLTQEEIQCNNQAVRDDPL